MSFYKKKSNEQILLDSIDNGEHLLFSRLLDLISKKKIWNKYLKVVSNWTNEDYQQAFDKMHYDHRTSHKFYFWAKKNQLAKKYINNNFSGKKTVNNKVDLVFENFLFEIILSRKSRLLELLRDIKKLLFYHYQFLISILDNLKKNEIDFFDGIYVDSPPQYNGTKLFPQWITSIYENEEGNFKINTNIKNNFYVLKKTIDKRNGFTFFIKQNSNKNPHPALTLNQFFKISLNSLLLIIVRIKNIILKDNNTIISLFQIVQSKCFEITLNRNEVNKYYLPYTGKLTRDLWIKIAENSGKEVIDFNYSANLAVLHDGYCNIDTHRARLGSVYNVKIFSKELKNFSDYNNKNFKLHAFEDPPVWSWVSNEYKKFYFKNKIAIFDISPHYPLGIGIDYMTVYTRYYNDVVKFSQVFFDDILSLCYEQNIKVILKQKRPDKQIFKEYLDLINNLKKKFSNFEVIDYFVSSEVIAKNSLATISQCFTSTAYYNKYLDNHIFYDPTLTLKKGYITELNRIVITGKKDLSKWIKKIANKDVN